MRTVVYILSSIVCTLLGATVVYAWTGPTSTPPTGNVSPPIYQSASSQTLYGNLYIGTGYGFATPVLCIGSDCRSSWPTSGTSQWTTLGSNIYYNTGNVGIGTSTPQSKLVVSNNANSVNILKVTADTNANVTGVSIGDMGFGNYASIQTTNQSLALNPLGNSVGVGTSTPWSDRAGVPALFDLSASVPRLMMHPTGSAQEISMSSDGTGLYVDLAGAATASNNSIIFRTSNTNSSYSTTEAMRITSAGYVGIGTSAPYSKLLVNNGQDSSSIVVVTAGTAASVTGLRIGDVGGIGGSTTLQSVNQSLNLNPLGNSVYVGADLIAPQAKGVVIRARATFPFTSDTASCPSAPATFNAFVGCVAAFDEKCTKAGYLGGVSIDWDAVGIDGFCFRKGASGGNELNLN